MRRLRPHDLLWLTSASVLRFDAPAPAWATSPWLAVAPVVVRRATPVRGGAMLAPVPVGLRGAARGERCAAWVSAMGVLRVIDPETVARSAMQSVTVRTSDLACLRVLSRLAPVLDASTLAWGITGSVGFALASGFDVLRPDSDLDVLLRAPASSDAQSLRELGAALAPLDGLGARLDVQVDTGAGAFALTEWLRASAPVLLKTDTGPRLVADPWAAV